MTEPLLISIKDAAAMLSLSPRTVANLLRAGTLKHIKKGRRTLIPAAALKAYAARSDTHRLRPLSPKEATESA